MSRVSTVEGSLAARASTIAPAGEPAAKRSAASPAAGAAALPDSRERILAAAAVLFAERGYEGASTRAIADTAGAKQALIRYHFGGKEPLWREVIERGLAAAADRVERATAGDQDRIAALLATFAAQPHWVQAIVHALLEPGARRDWLLARLAPLRARALPWLTGGERALRSTGDELFLGMWLAAAVAPAAFAPALEAASGRRLDAAAVQRAQHEVLVPWLLGSAALASSSGAWSLAAARRRRLTAPR
jgi:TetR/AcrR family transcriptional regulator